MDPQAPAFVLPGPSRCQAGQRPSICARGRLGKAFQCEGACELPKTKSRAGNTTFREADSKDVLRGRRRLRDRAAGRESGQKNNAAPDPRGGGAASKSGSGQRPERAFYLLSPFGASSSTTHGQKFCGFRVVAAFLMTVIFMSLLRFW